jgi:glycosyltransferase involved in cell wall biosynthesis
MNLTIITINKDNADGLRKTMQSVRLQTWQDFEYIIIDGASTDGSKDIIEEYVNSFFVCGKQDLSWLSEPDSGVYQAMNKGIRMAKGEYLLFLNSGDFLVDKDVLQQVFSSVYKADILCGKCNVSDKGRVIWTSDPPEFITFGTLYNVGLAHQSTFIKKSLFDRLGLYREDFKYNADIEFWYRSIISGNATTQKIDKIIADYNMDGISSRETHTEIYQRELQSIFDNPQFRLFVPDYERSKKEREEMKIMYWVKSKSWLYFFIKQIYNFAFWSTKIKNR